MSFNDVKKVMASYVEGPSSLKFTLVAIAERADKDTHDCWPSQATIASDINVSERTVRTAMAELERRGLITRKARARGHLGRTSDRITIHTDRLTAVRPLEDGEKDDQPAESAGGSDDQPATVSDQPATVAGEQGREPITSISPLVSGAGGGSTGESHQSPSQDVTAPPAFPEFAKAILGNIDNAEKVEWGKTWAAITSLLDTAWDPTLHLTKYLAQCKDRRRTPKPHDWARWYAEDERDAAAKRAVERNRTTTTDSPNPYWE